mmetsp:Transcript_48076/g.122092  ORF Transcript_48076/g.122092 Transcript_48076/m.122092 type:complete len:298 (-) Transcript_48076:184-1077(-)
MLGASFFKALSERRGRLVQGQRHSHHDLEQHLGRQIQPEPHEGAPEGLAELDVGLGRDGHRDEVGRGESPRLFAHVSDESAKQPRCGEPEVLAETPREGQDLRGLQRRRGVDVQRKVCGEPIQHECHLLLARLVELGTAVGGLSDLCAQMRHGRRMVPEKIDDLKLCSLGDYCQEGEAEERRGLKQRGPDLVDGSTPLQCQVDHPCALGHELGSDRGDDAGGFGDDVEVLLAIPVVTQHGPRGYAQGPMCAPQLVLAACRHTDGREDRRQHLLQLSLHRTSAMPVGLDRNQGLQLEI